MADPFHAGEHALQDRVGVRAQIAELGQRIMRDAMPDQHRELFARLPFVLVGSVGQDGQPHASVLAGPPGFLSSPDPRQLRIAALPNAPDPLALALRPGASLGLLGIEPHTRRRNRMNGVVSSVGPDGFTVEVRQSFGNCPKYIQARTAQWIERTPARGRIQRARQLDAAAERLIAAADTFFIASAHPAASGDVAPAHGVDVSHRGGKPGFVRIDRAGAAERLTVPDFSGNAMFNTLGNLALNPRAGLLFLDFDHGDLLQLTADAEIIWHGPELAAFDGAERLLRLRIREVLRIDAALPLRFGEPELSPFLLPTGAW